ncbi:MAG: hypothetical protein WCZ00_00940 [Acholeplasmataceae bacterium]
MGAGRWAQGEKAGKTQKNAETQRTVIFVESYTTRNGKVQRTEILISPQPS